MRDDGLFSYENRLLLLLGFAFGVAFFDRNAASYLAPFMEHELRLSTAQVGLIGSALSLTWALGAYLIARWSDASGVRKPFLLAFLVIFSACSFLSGLAPNFPVLLASRAIMGAVEGPFLPVCLAIMAVESSEHRRGVNAGIMQNFFASVLGQFLAPIVLVSLAVHFGWRSAFYVSGVPGLLCALAVLAWVREPRPAVRAADSLGSGGAGAGSGPHMGLIGMLRVRNILVCCLISVFMVAYLVMGWTYLPQVFIDARHFSPTAMKYLVATLGAASALSGFVVPFISDRIGRKPAMLAFCLLGLCTPLGALYDHGSNIILGALLFAGWFASGTFPLFMGVIPGETISRRYSATAMGLIVFVGEVIGGFGINTLGGIFGDVYSMQATLLIQAACTLVGGALCLLLIETAPVRVSTAHAHRIAADAVRRPVA